MHFIFDRIIYLTFIFQQILTERSFYINHTHLLFETFFWNSICCHVFFPKYKKSIMNFIFLKLCWPPVCKFHLICVLRNVGNLSWLQIVLDTHINWDASKNAEASMGHTLVVFLIMEIDIDLLECFINIIFY